MIGGNYASFTRKYKKQWKWPAKKFEGAGRKLKPDDVQSLPYNVNEQHAALLLWCNGGTPLNKWYHPKDEAYEIEYFFGIDSDHDLSLAILRYRDNLPRYSIPLASVNDDLGDTGLLLTFPFDPAGMGRENKVWYYTWYDEEDAEDPNDPEMLAEVSGTIKKLVDKLRADPPQGFYDEE